MSRSRRSKRKGNRTFYEMRAAVRHVEKKTTRRQGRKEIEETVDDATREQIVAELIED